MNEGNKEEEGGKEGRKEAGRCGLTRVCEKKVEKKTSRETTGESLRYSQRRSTDDRSNIHSIDEAVWHVEPRGAVL